MPVTVIDPVPALVVVDLQQGLRGRDTVDPFDDVVARAAALAAAFRALALPVALVSADGQAPGRTERGPVRAERRPPGFADLLPELDQQPGDLTIRKQTWGAFGTTDLHGLLSARGVTQVVLAGVATSKGVESTARQAHELGYHVVLVTDAMTDMDAADHAHSIGSTFPALGERATTAEVVAGLERRGAGSDR